MHKNDYISRIKDLAVRALVYELNTTPKPGLVDKINSGAHKDMDYEMFKASACSLGECFGLCTYAGLTHEEGPLAFRLRKIGLAGEKEMFKTTGGVNTHKGLVFSLGIICAACGILGQDLSQDEAALQETCAKISRSVLEENTTMTNTHGNQVYAKTGVYGVKGEALGGFNTAFKVGLPALRKALAEGLDGNAAMVKTLLSLMTVCEDSNVVYRGGLEGLAFVREEAAKILEDFSLEKVSEFDAECIKRNLSPGGSADLLAITAMLHMIIDRKEGQTW